MARRVGFSGLMISAVVGLSGWGCGSSAPPITSSADQRPNPSATAAASHGIDPKPVPTCTGLARGDDTQAPALATVRPEWKPPAATLSMPGAREFEGPAKAVPRRGSRPKLPPGAVARIGGAPGVGGAWRISPQAKLFIGLAKPSGMAIYDAYSRERVAEVENNLVETGMHGSLSGAKLCFVADLPVFAFFAKERRPTEVRIYSTASGRLEKTHKLPTGAQDVFFDTHGRRAAVLFTERAGQPVRLVVLDLASGATRELTLPVAIGTDRTGSLSSDGTLFVSNRTTKPGEALTELVDLGTGTIRWSSSDYGGEFHVFSPKDAWIAATGHGETEMIDAATGKLAYARSGRLVAFTPEGRGLLEYSGFVTERDFDGSARVRMSSPVNDYAAHAVVTGQGKVVLATTMNPEMYWWERSTGQPLLMPAARMHGVELSFSHDGRQLIGNDGEYLHRWDARSGQPIDRRRRPNSLEASESGQLLLATRGRAALERAEQAAVRATGLAENRSFDLSRDGSRLVVTSIGGSAVDVVIDLRTGQVRPLEGRFYGGRAGLSPDGELIAQWLDPVRLVRSATGELVREIDFPGEDAVSGGLFSPDGKWIAVGDETARMVWLARVDGTAPPTGMIAGEGATSFAFSPDGRRLAVGHADGTVDVRTRPKGQLHQQFVGHRGTIYGVAFSPDGSRLVSHSDDGTALVWRVR